MRVMGGVDIRWVVLHCVCICDVRWRRWGGVQGVVCGVRGVDVCCGACCVLRDAWVRTHVVVCSVKYYHWFRCMLCYVLVMHSFGRMLCSGDCGAEVWCGAVHDVHVMRG